MTRYNQRYLLPNARTNNGLNFTTKGNSEVFYSKPDNRYITSPTYGAATDSWTLRTSPHAAAGTTGLFFINNVFYLVSVANGGGTDGYIYTSPDAVTWTLRRTSSFGGHIGISGWYNPGLSRYEVCVVGTGMGNPYALASIDNGVNWTSTAGGWTAGTGPSFIKPDTSAQNKFLIGTVAGGLWEVFYAPSSTITSVAASPLGAVALTAFERASIGMGTNYFYMATSTNVLAYQSGGYTSSWTVTNSPAVSGDYIVDMRTRNSGIGQVVLVVSTKQGKIYAGAPVLGTIAWQDISPAPLNRQADATAPTYKFIYNGQTATNDIGIAPSNGSSFRVTEAMTTQNVARTILSTSVF